MSASPAPASKGPRPLRLVSSTDSPIVTSPSPLTPSSAFNSKRNSQFNSSSPRRQSSISYNPSSSRDTGPSSPALFSPRHANPNPNPNSTKSGPGLNQFTPSTPDRSALLSRSASVGARGSRSVDFDVAARNGRQRAYPGTPSPARSGFNNVNGRANRSSTGSLAALDWGPEERAKERPPLTLVEKHAELLHFIAQKESKCLELRSQLAAHEAELLQLKKKWERIVSRGFEKSQGQSSPYTLTSSPLSSTPSGSEVSTTHPPSSSIYSAASLSYLESLSTQAQGAGSVAMLEAIGGMKGIRESVQSVQQGVGRFLGAVAGTGPTSTTPSEVDLSTTPTRNAFTHSSSQSLSSVSTYATTTGNSTRLSLSSQSSYGILEEELESSEQQQQGRGGMVNGQRSQKKQKPDDIAIFSDTGATPLVSPTRDFAFDEALATPLSKGSNTTSRESTGGSTLSRRKSKTSSPSSPTTSSSPSPHDHGSPSDFMSSDSEPILSSPSLLDWGMGLSPDPALAHSSSKTRSSVGKRDMDLDVSSSKARKRMSLPARTMSSGSFENQNHNGEKGMSSWVGSVVGKRWEKTISKNQKRASLLISDVSQSISQSIPQSIVQALVSPPVPVSSTGGSLTPSYPNGNPSAAASTSLSLLDEDIPQNEESGILEPMLRSPLLPSPARAVVPKPKSPMNSGFGFGKGGGDGRKSKSGKQEEDDDEWNW